MEKRPMMNYRKPHRVRRKKSLMSSRFFLASFFIIVILSAAVYFLFFSDFFQVRIINISGNNKVSQEQILKVMAPQLNNRKYFFPEKNIILIDYRQLKQDILFSLPQVAEVKVGKHLPDTISLTIKERETKAVFCQETFITDNEQEIKKEECFLLDREGVLFENILFEENQGLLKIKKTSQIDNLNLGQKIIDSELVSGILNILTNLQDIKINLKEVVIVSPERINVQTAEGCQIYFDPSLDLEWQLEKLKAVLKESIPLEDRKRLDYIDLRFGNLAPFKYLESED